MTENMTVTVPDEKQAEINELVEWASAAVVKSENEREQAMEIARGAKNQKKWFDNLFDENIQKANLLHKDMVKQKKQFTNLLIIVEDKVKAAVLTYDKEQKAIYDAEQRRLQAVEEAKRRKEEERLRKEAEKIKTPELKQARLEEAEEVKATIPVAPSYTPPKRKGESTKKTWKARIIDEGTVPREYMTINMKALNALARATKGAINIPGVQFYEDRSLAIG